MPERPRAGAPAGRADGADGTGGAGRADGADGQDAEAFVAVGVASRPRPGQQACGDQAIVRAADGRWVLAAIDGLGHGPEAEHSALLAAAVVTDNPEASPAELLTLGHARLGGSRGAAATVAVINAATGTLDWLGVGNVDGVVVRADGAIRPGVHGVFLAAGVLGVQMPTLPSPRPVQLQHGDCILLATDGVRTDLAEAARSGLRPPVLAQAVLDRYAEPTDDALVVVARYFGPRRARVAW
jgi:phosphoserine phosphatase RsbX